MQIFIKNIKARKTFPIEIAEDDCIEDVKLAIEAAQGVEPRTQCLVFGGKTLKGGVPISELGVSKDASLHLVIRAETQRNLTIEAVGTGEVVKGPVAPPTMAPSRLAGARSPAAPAASAAARFASGDHANACARRRAASVRALIEGGAARARAIFRSCSHVEPGRARVARVGAVGAQRRDALDRDKRMILRRGRPKNVSSRRIRDRRRGGIAHRSNGGTPRQMRGLTRRAR